MNLSLVIFEGEKLCLVLNRRDHPQGLITPIPAETSPTSTPPEEASAAAGALGIVVAESAWEARGEIGGVMVLTATAPLGQCHADGELYPLIFLRDRDWSREPLSNHCLEVLRHVI